MLCYMYVKLSHLQCYSPSAISTCSYQSIRGRQDEQRPQWLDLHSQYQLAHKTVDLAFTHDVYNSILACCSMKPKQYPYTTLLYYRHNA